MNSANCPRDLSPSPETVRLRISIQVFESSGATGDGRRERHSGRCCAQSRAPDRRVREDHERVRRVRGVVFLSGSRLLAGGLSHLHPGSAVVGRTARRRCARAGQTRHSFGQQNPGLVYMMLTTIPPSSVTSPNLTLPSITAFVAEELSARAPASSVNPRSG
jgi:hypothetical protein